MKKTGSDMPSPDAAPGGSEGTAEIIERAQLQAEVSRQRVRLAKEELQRARKRLKEAKREARRARKHAASTRKALKRARRKAKKDGGTSQGQADKVVVVAQRRKSRPKSAAARTRRSATKRSSIKRAGSRTRARAGK
jgi:hypothetical protein